MALYLILKPTKTKPKKLIITKTLKESQIYAIPQPLFFLIYQGLNLPGLVLWKTLISKGIEDREILSQHVTVRDWDFTTGSRNLLLILKPSEFPELRHSVSNLWNRCITLTLSDSKDHPDHFCFYHRTKHIVKWTL